MVAAPCMTPTSCTKPRELICLPGSLLLSRGWEIHLWSLPLACAAPRALWPCDLELATVPARTIKCAVGQAAVLSEGSVHAAHLDVFGHVACSFLATHPFWLLSPPYRFTWLATLRSFNRACRRCLIGPLRTWHTPHAAGAPCRAAAPRSQPAAAGHCGWAAGPQCVPCAWQTRCWRAQGHQKTPAGVRNGRLVEQ
jgi:hypothetical protein